jgi:hypothetical protein
MKNIPTILVKIHNIDDNGYQTDRDEDGNMNHVDLEGNIFLRREASRNKETKIMFRLDGDAKRFDFADTPFCLKDDGCFGDANNASWKVKVYNNRKQFDLIVKAGVIYKNNEFAFYLSTIPPNSLESLSTEHESGESSYFAARYPYIRNGASGFLLATVISFLSDVQSCLKSITRSKG